MIGVPGADEALEKCVGSMRGQADEVIVVANTDMGYGPAVNAGLKMTHGDFIVVSNNDIQLWNGKLIQLTYWNKVTVPLIHPTPRDYNPRSFFCMDRKVYEIMMDTNGYFYDPIFEGGYFEDDDLIRRLQTYGIVTQLVYEVTVDHLNGGGLSMKTIGEQEHYDANLLRFREKWGISASL